ncbi:hypothetical protein PENARI_c003G02725 [Penicillium arizonense]|uniref:Xylanolytic transcriptional activator regulatory domain-containing protein n=1 Tax=Penicillium arizonense TaxID=1835702 RepID=A0A1F5LSX5_PENAI|nr:hypothetical protein PENARI_c003G02725 [Penicillium arizonense]OGE56308.1 hypothetical protein PENARI_c003G02725 [Penicillium arizonense]
MDDGSPLLSAMSTSGLNPRRRRPPVCIYENSAQPLRRLGNEPTFQLNSAQEYHEPQNSFSVWRSSAPTQERTPQTGLSQPTATSSIAASTPSSHSSTREVEFLRSKIRELEEQLSKAAGTPTQSTAPTPTSDIETTTSQLAGTFHVHNENLPSNHGESQVISRTFWHKTRLYGQSHWIGGISLLRELAESIEPYLLKEGSKAVSGLQKCKYLGKMIKSQRAPQWPVPVTPDLPTRDVCDTLVDCYLRTVERIYRVVHIPTFRKEYAKIWPSETQPDAMFLVQLKLVLAIGTITYDEDFSLRSWATHSIYEAQTWASEPEFKSRLAIPFLQIQILLLIARELIGVDGRMVWVSAGALMRTAMYMGLHRDPACIPKMSRYASEMRRRLWNTILEICLQSSMESGGLPLISVDDFDTEAPGNFEDDQLEMEDCTSHPESKFTSVSIAIALRKMFPIRLAIAKSLNDVRCQSSYEETLRLDAKLRSCYKEMCRTLREYISRSAQNSLSRFELLVLDFIMRRYLLSIHIPFFGPSLHETAYAFSRNVVVETALKLFTSAHRSHASRAGSSLNTDKSPGETEFSRLVVNGSGFFRTAPMNACFLISVEIRTRIEEEESLDVLNIRPDLLAVMHDAKALNLRCIEVGETNTKGYLFMSLALAQIDALRRGATKEETPLLLIKAAEDAEEDCLSILEHFAAKGQNEKNGDGLDSSSTNPLPEMVGDWDFMMADDNLDFPDLEPVSWMMSGIPYGIP